MVRRLSKCARNPIWTSCFRYTALENDVWSLQTNPATKAVTYEQTPGKYLLDTSPKSNQDVLSLAIQINAGAYLLFKTWYDLRVFLIIPDEIGVNHGFLTPHPPPPTPHTRILLGLETVRQLLNGDYNVRGKCSAPRTHHNDPESSNPDLALISFQVSKTWLWQNNQRKAPLRC